MGWSRDRTRGTISLFNDRYGMHRLCYHESPDCFYFASEAKAILAVCQELRVGDPRGIGEFVTCSCVLENRTIFKDIDVLPAASNWTFRNGHCESKNTYFTPSEWEAQELLSEQAYYEELRSTLFRRLPTIFTGRQRLGIAMTGGLDTRSSWLAIRHHRGRFPAIPSEVCFAIRTMYESDGRSLGFSNNLILSSWSGMSF